MATKKTAPPSKSTAIAKWDEELAKQAEIASKMEENVGGGQFFSTKGGVLTWQDAPMPNNQMAVIVLDSVLENVFYEGRYDPDTPQSPVCFAFGRDEKTIQPHTIVIENGNSQAGASGLCAGCDHNQWGSADTGRGKACRNTRRLAMIPAGTFDQMGKFKIMDDPEHFQNASIGFMKLPVTSVKGYANFVKQVAGALRRPPFGIITKVRVIPDASTQFKVVFEPITEVPDDLMGTIMERHQEAESTIDFPYRPAEEQPPPPPRGSRAAKQPGKQQGRAAARKY